MAYDASIILGARPINALGALAAGTVAAERANEVTRQNALAGLFKDQGANIVNGDPAALNALAGISPEAALGFKQQQQGMAFDAEQMQMLRDKARMATEAHAATMSAEERAREAAIIERGVAAGLAARTPEEWDAIVTQYGAPDMVGKFDQRQAIAYGYMGIADALKATEPAAPLSAPGKLAADLAAGRITQEQFDAASKPEPGVVVNMGGNTTEFTKESDKKAAERLNEIVASGQSAQALSGDVTALASLAAGIGTGKAA